MEEPNSVLYTVHTQKMVVGRQNDFLSEWRFFSECIWTSHMKAEPTPDLLIKGVQGQHKVLRLVVLNRCRMYFSSHQHDASESSLTTFSHLY